MIKEKKDFQKLTEKSEQSGLILELFSMLKHNKSGGLHQLYWCFFYLVCLSYLVVAHMHPLFIHFSRYFLCFYENLNNRDCRICG